MAEIDGDQPPVWDRFRIPIILIAVSVCSLILCLTLFIQSQVPAPPIEFISADSIATDSAMIMVDVAGGVSHPGVYDLRHGARIEDAINAAGGLSDDADEEAIAKGVNRARIIIDGEKIYIPLKAGTENRSSSNQTTTGMKTSLVSINSASISQLDTLPGVGEVTARKIIDGRPYVALEDLVTRKVITSSVFDKLKDQISL